MPFRLDVKKKLSTRSERVKSVDIHPTEPWVLSALYSGNVVIHNYETQSVVKSLEISPLPIRCAKFIVRQQWIITGGDDMTIRCYNYNTLDKIKVVDAHTDYIRYLAVHPTLPYVLSASDDMSVRLWDWERDWQRVCTYESHAHYVMMVQWSPKDSHIFASACLDRTIKVWSIQHLNGGTVTAANFTLTGHERGVNSVFYSTSNDRPYLISGSDDRSVRVWDYQTKQCLQELKGHTKNISAAVYHPHLPVLFTASEDGTIKLWHSSTYRLETTLTYAMDRAWSLSVVKGQNALAIGFDEGTVVLKLGTDVPIASMMGGKIVWARASEIQMANVKLIPPNELVDNERLNLAVKDMGACEIYPQSISHHPNGRFIVVCGDGEYIVYTGQALRNKTFGRAFEFVWSDEGHYAVRGEGNTITVYKNFTEAFKLKPDFQCDCLFGGKLIGARGVGDFICFYDWDEYRMIRRIDVSPQYVWWSDSANYVCLGCTDCMYILQHDKDAVAAAISAAVPQEEDGIDIAFTLLQEIPERVESGIWVSDSFIYITSRMRIQVYGGGCIDNVGFVDKPLYVLGYCDNRLYVIDRDLNVVTFMLHQQLLNYQAAIIRKDFEAANVYLADIPQSLYNRVSRFLDNQGYKEHALNITQDMDHKFDLALQLGKLYLCSEIIRETEKQTSPPCSSISSMNRWKQLGDVALEVGDFPLALQAFTASNDFHGMLLILSSIGDKEKLARLAVDSAQAMKYNIAVMVYILLRDHAGVLQVLVDSKRIPEAAFYARTYCPSKLPEIMKLWKKDLNNLNAMVAQSIADPTERPDLFHDYEQSLKTELEMNGTV